MIKTLSYLFFFVLIYFPSFAQVNVDVNLNVKHSVGGFSTFDRSKFILVHSDLTDNNWTGDEDKLKYLIQDLDVYFGRENGSMGWSLSNVDQDPSRPGFANPSTITSFGTRTKNSYATSTSRHQYESKQSLMTASLSNYYPGSTDGIGAKFLNSRNPNTPVWTFSKAGPFGRSLGEFMGRWVRDYHRPAGNNNPAAGRPKPKYVEVMNEPVWPLVDVNKHGGGTIDDIFTMHNTVADQIKIYSPDTQVGGFTTAFPEFSKNNFAQWNQRWKKFIDVCGAKMDFYSFHLYDFPGINRGQEKYRKGANNEATMDMLDHYGFLTGKRKKFLISEYGSQLHDWFNQPWTPFRDWLCIKAMNSMLIQFMERPDRIIGAMPFTPVKAEWGRISESIPYYWRLLRRANEPASNSGAWVWTDQIKFYELWSKVKGTRVDSKQSDINIQTDAYVNGNKAYVILNNLSTTVRGVNLNIKGMGNRTVQSVSAKRLFLNGANNPALTTSNLSTNLSSRIDIRTDETIILEYTFNGNIAIPETSSETKYFAIDYNKPILAGLNREFTFRNISKSTHGEAVLRIGIGRAKNLSRTPSITVNGTPMSYSGVIYRGDNQADRDDFFGLLEIPVPYNLLVQGDNKVAIKFNDNGGRVSSITLQAFNFSTNIRGGGSGNGGNNNSSFFIVNRKTKKKIRPTNGNDNSTIIQVDASATGNAVKWEQVSVAGSTEYFYLKNVSTGKYFRPTSSNTQNASGSPADGSSIIQKPTSYSGAFTQWRKVPTSSGYFYLQNRATQMYFRPANDNNNSVIQQRPTTYGGSYTQWKFDGASAKSSFEGKQVSDTNQHFVYPNPVTGSEFTLSTKGFLGDIEIFDVMGKSLFRVKSTGEDAMTFKTNMFKAKGLYFIRMISKRDVETLKIVFNNKR